MNRYHALARAKGWHDKALTSTRVRSIQMLVVSEVAELVEELRRTPLERCAEPQYSPSGAKPIGAWSELADIEIRCWDLAGALALDDGVQCRIGYLAESSKRHNDTYEETAPLSETDDALSYWADVCESFLSRDPDDSRDSRDLAMRVALADMIHATRVFARRVGIGIAAACDAKHAYNETRPDRHGGKLA
jgi:hypothetical protein